MALALAAGILGCGGGDGGGSSESTGTPSAAAGAADTGVSPRRDGGGRQAGKTGSGDGGGATAEGKNGGEAGKNDGKASSESGQGGSAPTPEQVAALEKQAAEHCPKGLGLDQCKALVKAAKQMQDAPSYAVAKPEDCLKTMSRGDCEEIYAAQKQAAEAAGASVDVRACLENPTPECEAVVRPILERQRDAEEASK